MASGMARRTLHVARGERIAARGEKIVSSGKATDLRTTYKYYNNTNSSINSGLPSAADANKYFYLPALGYYNSGRLNDVGRIGYYWSSSADPRNRHYAYTLYFLSGSVYVYRDNRLDGFRAEALQ